MLSAGQNLRARAAQIASSDRAIQAAAGRDVSIEAGQNWSEARHSTRSGVLSSTTVTSLHKTRDTRALAATASGQSVSIEAIRDTQVTGSNLVSDAGTTLVAGNNVSIEAAIER